MSAPPIIILCRPQLGENIGKAARAMLNFGLTEMRLVAPRDGWPSVARGDKTHFGQAEVEHGARRFTDIFAQLRTTKNDDRRRAHFRAASTTLPAKSSKSLASLKSL